MAYIKIKQLKRSQFFRFKGKKNVYKFGDLGQVKAYYSPVKASVTEYVTTKLSSLVQIVKS